jgi:uncharacterized protein (DUF433 family)
MMANHIEITPGVCGGKPRIAGTRIRVQDIYVWHEAQGQSVDEIVSHFPQLSMGAVHAALAYFWDHRDAIMRQMREDDTFIADMKQRAPSALAQKFTPPHASDDQISPR